jgi:hypothetical protein
MRFVWAKQPWEQPAKKILFEKKNRNPALFANPGSD